MKQRIAVLHESWLTNAEVGADEIAVLAVMALHASKNGTCFPSQGLLARLLGKSRPWVCKKISRLVQIGIVEKTDRARLDGGRRTSFYRLVPPVCTPCHSEHMAGPTGDSPCHAHDNITPKQELKVVDSPRARESADCSESGHEVPVAKVPVQEVKVAVTPEEGWQPSDKDLIYGIERFPEADLQAATEKFVNKCRAKGYRYSDLGASWRVWLAEDQADKKTKEFRYGNGVARTSPAQAKFDVWASVARAASGGGLHHGT